MFRLSTIILAAALLLAACDRPAKTDAPAPTEAPQAAKEKPVDEQPTLRFDSPGEPIATRHPEASRVVAIGDVHGDLEAFERALRLSGLIDDEGNWTGGETVFVQTGDLLDRGDDEPEIIALMERLEKQAKAAGGKVVALNGNHETMNVRGDLRYVTPEGFTDFHGVEGVQTDRPGFERVPEDKRERLAAFLPGGPVAKLLSHHNMVAVVGDSVFVHGGLLPEHADYGIERINDETRRWMLGEADAPAFMQSRDPMPPNWVRLYSRQTNEAACETLDAALEKLGAERMVVGHTPQMSGITSACDGKVWRIDVGMSAHYGGTPQALEISGDEVRVLRENE
ncbi:calcineurin [Persicimonas caeni]|uniref:Calcineurin n=1 Tax=Persicimonas caeni TaxID=2292766 RepID=A0A4Y6PZ94_PERCE|nr:shewanella-like protein phosphatase [Persicimonas caeni]QDG53489.1 calcineurin [Persicimonas caeni]QED34710.1 calcineurin [Persicimonas caeni]